MNGGSADSGPRPEDVPTAGTTTHRAWGPDPTLQAYLEANRGRYTDDALTDALVKAGYTAESVRSELKRLAQRDAAVPIRARARWIVIALYAVGYVVLVAAMLTNPTTGLSGAGAIGTVVLTIALGGAFVIAMLWLRRIAGSLALFIALPAVLWLIVTGLCVATGLPFSGRGAAA